MVESIVLREIIRLVESIVLREIIRLDRMIVVGEFCVSFNSFPVIYRTGFDILFHSRFFQALMYKIYCVFCEFNRNIQTLMYRYMVVL